MDNFHINADKLTLYILLWMKQTFDPEATWRAKLFKTPDSRNCAACAGWYLCRMVDSIGAILVIKLLDIGLAHLAGKRTLTICPVASVDVHW